MMGIPGEDDLLNLFGMRSFVISMKQVMLNDKLKNGLRQKSEH